MQKIKKLSFIVLYFIFFKGYKMKALILSLTVLILTISGCSFGEYADDSKSTSDVNGTYRFTKDGVKNKTFYKVYKASSKWKMSEYDFNTTNYSANQLQDNNATETGTYSITDKGYIKLSSFSTTTYIKATSEDTDKIWLLWTTNANDLNKTTPTKDTYFFKTKSKADDFVK